MLDDEGALIELERTKRVFKQLVIRKVDGPGNKHFKKFGNFAVAECPFSVSRLSALALNRGPGALMRMRRSFGRYTTIVKVVRKYRVLMP
mmetsp:Transcript_10848/g.24602  ORF Transcript_10848/g.24602 Transcript_10848/m.24602 type:complete len:90 (+) Transcript_10848:444-713(+)